MPRAFALASVLTLRKQKEEAEERALANANAQVQQAMVSLARVEHEIAQSAATRVREVNATHTAAHHQASHARSRLLREAHAELRAQLRATEIRRDDQRTQYLAARTNREMLTELQQQQRSAWDAELGRRDQKQLDDLFNARRLRNQATFAGNRSATLAGSTQCLPSMNKVNQISNENSGISPVFGSTK